MTTGSLSTGSLRPNKRERCNTISIDLTHFGNSANFTGATLVILREQLQAVLDAGIGYTGFVATFSRVDGRYELVGMLNDNPVWFSLGQPSDSQMLQFARAVFVACHQPPQPAYSARH